MYNKTIKTMLEILQRKYEAIQDENLNLMGDHLSKGGRKPTKKMRENYVLLTKLGQMIRKFK